MQFNVYVIKLLKTINNLTIKIKALTDIASLLVITITRYIIHCNAEEKHDVISERITEIANCTCVLMYSLRFNEYPVEFT